MNRQSECDAVLAEVEEYLHPSVTGPKLYMGDGDTPEGYIKSNAYPVDRPSNSVAEIQAFNVLQRFGCNEIYSVLFEWFRLLKRGGVISVTVPGFNKAIAYYKIKEIADGVRDGLLPNIGSVLMGGQQTPDDFNRSLWDGSTLIRAMSDAGFADVFTFHPPDEDVRSWQVLENVEARKPDVSRKTNLSAKPLPQFAWLAGIDLYLGYSQFGEECIVATIIERLGIEDGLCFECGAGNGITLSNTRQFIKDGWNAVLMDCDDESRRMLDALYGDNFLVDVRQGVLGPGGETLDRVLGGAALGKYYDFVVIDIDGQDYHVIDQMESRPKVLMVEYAFCDEDQPPPPVGGEGQAGAVAMGAMICSKGYTLVAKTPCNWIAVRDDLVGQIEEGNDDGGQ